ncbi:MAG: VWA domain-containing protein [Gemmatimonadetes bacterium]|nr:VWA domain-containing protein [Gemmatimonadota bacterium]
MTFDSPAVLWLAPVVALAVLGLAVWAGRRRLEATKGWLAAAPATALRRLTPGVLAVVGGLVVVGAAGPRFGSADVDTETRALNLVFAIDISRSMLAEDAAPSRLARAVRESRRLLQDVRGDRVALLAFAGRSYILTPLTLDDGAVQLQLDALDPDIASEGGTELAAVLRQGKELLEAASEGGARAMVVFTDGEAHDSLPAALAAARALKGIGVTVIVVGAGGLAPARIPLRDAAGALVEYKKDDAGAEVVTARRDEVLRAVADAAEGILVPADFPDQAGAVWKTLASLDRDPAKGRRTEDLIPRAWILALGAFAILALQTASRRTASLVAVAGLVLLPGRTAAQRPADGVRRLGVRDTAGAAAAFARMAQTRQGRDTAQYNSGVLALAQGRYDDARKALAEAARSLDPDIRFRALYNLGLVSLVEARGDSVRRDSLEAEAAGRFKDALLLSPASRPAKWNLELVNRRKPPPPNSGSSNRPPPRGGAPPPPSAVGNARGMSAAEAEQILRSVERAEQGVRNEQIRRRRGVRSSSGKDW